VSDKPSFQFFDLLSAEFAMAIIEFVVLWILCLWHLWVAYRLHLSWIPRVSWLLVAGLNFGNIMFFPPLNLWTTNSTIVLKIFWTSGQYLAAGVLLPLLPWIVLFLMWIVRPQYFYTIRDYRKEYQKHRREQLAMSSQGMRLKDILPIETR